MYPLRSKTPTTVNDRDPVPPKSTGTTSPTVQCCSCAVLRDTTIAVVTASELPGLLGADAGPLRTADRVIVSFNVSVHAAGGSDQLHGYAPV